MKIKHCADNGPHLHEHHLYRNLPLFTQCKVYGQTPRHLSLVTPPHNLRALTHSLLHHEFFPCISLYLKLPLPDLLSRIQRSHHPFLSPVNEKTPKPSSTHASYTSMDDHRNLVPNKTKLPGFYHICKPVRLVPGTSMSWLKSLRKPCGITQRMSSLRKFSDDSVTWISVQQCC